jgi:hypothetical protein
MIFRRPLGGMLVSLIALGFVARTFSQTPRPRMFAELRGDWRRTPSAPVAHARKYPSS